MCLWLLPSMNIRMVGHVCMFHHSLHPPFLPSPLSSSSPPSFLSPSPSLQFDCCGWVNITLWFESPFYDATMMFPKSCECPDGNLTTSNCIEMNDQFIYNRVCFFHFYLTLILCIRPVLHKLAVGILNLQEI